MSLFYSDHKELRSGWKILRVFVFAIVLTVLFALLSALLEVDVTGKYALHGAIIISIGLELWLEQKSLSFVGINVRDDGWGR